MDTVVIENKVALATSPEGKQASLDLSVLMDRMMPAAMDTRSVVLPAGTKLLYTRGNSTIWVHETPPAIYGLKWIAPDSPVQFGAGTKYRIIRIGLPYVIVFCVFGVDPRGRPFLTSRNECFFRTAPLSDAETDELLYPALLNCSKFPTEDPNPLAWICTEHLDTTSLLRIESTNQRMRESFKALMKCLLDSGFNRSSEGHEGASWFSETLKQGVDARIGSIERWQEETSRDPLFVLDVPWLKTGRTVAQMVERIFRLNHSPRAGIRSSADIARIIFNTRQKDAS